MVEYKRKKETKVIYVVENKTELENGI